jgi:hypothetical protein
MRFASVSAIVLTGFALAACTGAGDTTCGTIDILATGPCVAQGTSSGSGSGTTTSPVVPIPTNTGTSTNVGNATSLSTGDKTIALDFANLISPTTGSLSKLTEVAGVAGAPNTAKLAIDTKTSSNAAWPIPKTMEEYTFGTGAGIGLGGTYKEYRALSNDTAGTLNDEELQVWHWGSSYATQYRDATAGGGEARHQAWSFGGTVAAAMPVGGSATYTGQYGATSKTWNWVDDSTKPKTISANNSWMVEGTSSITANFGTKKMTGTLTPSTWTGWQSLNGASGFATVNAGNLLDPNHMSFMDDNVVLKGTISGSTIATGGTAKLDPAAGWANGTNGLSVMHAGFFGASGPSEVTGAYNFVAISPAPTGGQPPINDDRRGFVQQSGVFHGTCTPGVGACPP